jgi:hypothetical protein
VIAPAIFIREALASAVTIRQEGGQVLLIVAGRAVLEIPWRKADAVARAIVAKARAAEEHEKAMGIARDQAILLRAGVPLGLTSNPKIQDEAAKIAAWDRDLRRYMPGGVKSEEQLGTPAIRVHPRRVA